MKTKKVFFSEVAYILGIIVLALGTAMMNISPEVYELFVKEISAKSGKDINIIKTVYDCVSCLVGIMLSFAFFGLWHFEGVKLGTIICAFANGFLIGCFSKMTESIFDFKDALNLREKFEFPFYE